MQKLLGHGRRALRAKLQFFLPPFRRLVLAGVQHHLSLAPVLVDHAAPLLLPPRSSSSFRSLPLHEEPLLERKARLSSGGVQVQVASREN